MRKIIAVLIGTYLAAAPLLAGPLLTKAAVRTVVMEAVPEVSRCATNDETVNIRFVIEAEGHVTGVVVLGKHGADAIGTCMQGVIAALRFGHSIKSTPVSFPFPLGNAEPPAFRGSGQLSKKNLDGLLEILASDLKDCGEGAAHTTFTIKPTGRVANLQVMDVDNKLTRDCVTRKVGRLRFPAPATPTDIARVFSLEG